MDKDERFSVTRMLFDEQEQLERKHLLDGLRGVCQYASWDQDGRAMSLEIDSLMIYNDLFAYGFNK
jgi:hypothetical protein